MPAPGLYQSAHCEPISTPDGPRQFTRRQLEVGSAGSAWKFTLFADAACAIPLMHVRGLTRAELLGGARSVDGAVAVRVRFLDRHAMAYDSGMVAVLATAGCGRANWAVGVEQAIGQATCLGMPPIEACPFDYDVVRFDGNTLYTGQRSGDGTLCTPEREPSALNPWPLVRQ